VVSGVYSQWHMEIYAPGDTDIFKNRFQKQVVGIEPCIKLPARMHQGIRIVFVDMHYASENLRQ